MMYWIRNMRFSHKILFVFLAMMLVMMLSSGVVYYNYASEQIVENFNVSSRDLMRRSTTPCPRR